MSGSSDRKVRLWNLPFTSTDSTKVFSGPNSSVVCSSFLEDKLVIAYKNGTAKYIEMKDPDKVLSFEVLGGKIEGFLPLSGTAFVSWLNKIQIINYHHLHQSLLFTYSEHLRKVNCVKQFDSKFISTSADKSIHIWDPNAPNPTIDKVTNMKSYVDIQLFDDHTFITGGDTVIDFWDDRKFTEPFKTIDTQLKVSCLDYHDNTIIVGTNANVLAYRGADWNEKYTFNVNDTKNGVSAVRFKKNTLVAGFRDGGINLWEF